MIPPFSWREVESYEDGPDSEFAFPSEGPVIPSEWNLQNCTIV